MELQRCCFSAYKDFTVQVDLHTMPLSYAQGEQAVPLEAANHRTAFQENIKMKRVNISAKSAHQDITVTHPQILQVLYTQPSAQPVITAQLEQKQKDNFHVLRVLTATTQGLRDVQIAHHVLPKCSVDQLD